MFFSTSLAAVTVTGLLSAANVPAQPNWTTDYRHALSQAGTQHKPVAVFIGQGKNGADRVVADGTIGEQATQILRTGYVCLYVDTTTDAGKTLAGSFGIDLGLVISNKDGGLQALRHDGVVTQTDLTTYLQRFAQSETVITTESHGKIAPVSTVVPTTGLQPAAYAPVQSYVPATSYYPAYRPVVSGGCPNGQCPNRR